MKRNILFIFTLFMVLSSLFCVTASSNDISIYVDNNLIQITDAYGNHVFPFIQNGTTYVPLRGISENLDCTVIWDGVNNTILIYKDIQPDNSAFRNKTDEIKVYVDNKIAELKDANGAIVKPFVKNGTTYIPLRAISTVLGYYIEWDGHSRSVYVWKNEISPNGVPLDFMKPAETKIIERFYESRGETIDIDGTKYTNAISYGLWSGSNVHGADFNLDGKYDKITFVAGSIKRFDEEKHIQFVVDGKIIDTIVIKANSRAKEHSVNLQRGLQLKIVFDDAPNTALGNIRFWRN